MSDLISRKAAIDAMAELQGRASTKAELTGISKAWKKIKALPSAEPQERTGHWRLRESFDDTVAKCSECGFEMLVNQSGNGLHDVEDLVYCPSCGARMEENDG